MKTLPLVSVLAFSLLSINVVAKPKEVYLNQDLGFNIKGFNYNQKQLPCEVDKYLVNDIVKRGKKQDLNVTTVRTGDKISNPEVPVLSIEVNALSLGKKGFNFGKKVKNNTLPAMTVTAGLIRGKEQGGTILAKHSCAILTINQLSPGSSSVLDMGTYGVTVCDATKKCLKDLSKDIVNWVEPQL
ncbi:hypothetical protein [Paraglaciecola sp.]|uniref:hypothetical protein n=1 Tax=Paraglaciecola sp. TaxID=1920173 RepID=UPI003EF8E1C3